MLLHNDPHEADLAVTPGVYFASDKDKIFRLISAAEDRLQLFNVYSGWGAGQLEQELRVGGWLSIPATPEAVFNTAHDQLWQELTHHIGREITQQALHLTETPADPDLN
jgi:putative transcriptional regulator